MAEPERLSEATPEDGAKGGGGRVPRWTWWEILGLLVSAILVAGPLVSLAYSFLFPTAAPAQALPPTPVLTAGSPYAPWPLEGTAPNPDVLLPTPTSVATETPTPGPSPTPTHTPTVGPTIPTVPTVPTHTPGPTVPTATWTPQPTGPTVPTATPTPTGTPTTPPTQVGNVSVEKAANRDRAYVGETVVFSIGLSNGTNDPVNVTVDDTLPDNFGLQSVQETCSGGTIPFSGNTFHTTLGVPAHRACQINAVAVVVQGCDCYVRNTADWTIGGPTYHASSQPVFLPLATPTPTAGTPGPTWTPSPTFTPGPTWTPSPTFTPGPTWTPSPTFTPGPSPSPTATFTPGPSLTPSPTAPTGIPTVRPTARPGQPTPVPPTAAPTALCARARIWGEVCAAGVQVTISSCCPPWSAQTTTDAGGRFEFSNLTPGTFTIRAQGRSRQVTLETCESVVYVNLCPLTPVPATPVTPAPPEATAAALPTAEATAEATATRPGVQPPSIGDVTLALAADRTTVAPGQGVTFFLTLKNGREIAPLRGIVMRDVFPAVLQLRGAAGAAGEVRLLGQEVSLASPLLAGGQELTLRVDAVVRPDAEPWTTLTLQATAVVSGTGAIYSNFLDLQVVGAGPVPEGVATPPGGAGEILATPVAPVGGGGLGGELPYTGTGVPMIGIVLGGIVLLGRQVRLRRAAGKRP